MNVEYFKKLQDEERALCVRKNKAYGDDNITKFGLDGVIIRMNDKIERLITLAFNKRLMKLEEKINEESLIDTLMDISNYANIGIMVATRKWGDDKKEKK